MAHDTEVKKEYWLYRVAQKKVEDHHAVCEH